jgi:hypothetical protein
MAASPYIHHQGWDLKNGLGGGLRFEAQAIGILLGYELTAMSNTEACGTGCMEGDFGTTTFHAVDLGYRLRIPVGPVRPFAQLSVGGVMAKAGTWNANSNETVFGGQARAAAGVEFPFGDRYFASASLSYRFIMTANPLRETGEEDVNAALLDVDTAMGDLIEDAHLISILAGIGVEL